MNLSGCGGVRRVQWTRLWLRRAEPRETFGQRAGRGRETRRTVRAGQGLQSRRQQPGLNPTELDSVSRLDRVRTNTHRVAFHEPANRNDDTPDSPSARPRRRTHPPSISHLMQTALENPEIVSLAAGFVDQQSLPVELVGPGGLRAAGRPDRGPPRPPVRDDHRRPGLAGPPGRGAGCDGRAARRALTRRPSPGRS